MSSRGHPNRIVELRLSGKFAHFRKFYTNASSLTYTIPPRTAIVGMFASILKKPRDSYYKELNSDSLFLTASLVSDFVPHKFMQTLNYMPGNSKKELINDASSHKQCRFELLTDANGNDVSYRLWMGFYDDNKLLCDLVERIENENYGYGVYLGQRQFRAHIKLVSYYHDGSIQYMQSANYVDSAVLLDRSYAILENSGMVIIERMPLEQELETNKKVNTRRTVRSGEVLFHASGGRIEGCFNDCYQLENELREIICFL